ncbi:MAG: hypothetical protein EHM36_12945 [Deltaproteobacteria bacterium]|nr:MAG: hypothetical protein EHM36_12945 [Deltaproteobacteria bacterium]
MKEYNERTPTDRRARPTPALSRFTFYGRRKSFRRDEDKQRGGYVDRYSPGLLFCLVLILALNVLDVLFTLTILNAGGCEVNPVVGSAIDLWGDRFWVWKFGLSSGCVTLLCLHSRFRLVGKAILGITTIYVTLALYQLSLIIRL